MLRHFPAASFSTDNKDKKKRYTFVPAGPVDLEALNRRIRDFEAREDVVKAERDLPAEAARLGFSVDDYEELREQRETLGKIQDMDRESLRDPELDPALFEEDELVPHDQHYQAEKEREDLEAAAAETPYAYAM